MKKPRHQIFVTYISWVLAGFLALGTFLDGVANAVSLITFPAALIGTIVIAVLLISAQLYLNRYHLPWVANGETVKISKLNLGLLLPFLGMIVLLWTPTALNLLDTTETQPINHLQVSSVKNTDSLQVSSVKTVVDSKTEIREVGGQVVISAYWEVLLSNVGDNNLSVISYRVLQVGEDFPANWYTAMDQGLYALKNGEFKKTDIPIDISTGTTKKIFVRLGLMMTPEASKLVKEQFSKSSSLDTTLKSVWRFLNIKGTDFYGNKVVTETIDDTGKIISLFPAEKEVLEQEFVISFTTSRGQLIKKTLSWYRFGGAYDPSRYL